MKRIDTTLKLGDYALLGTMFVLAIHAPYLVLVAAAFAGLKGYLDWLFEPDGKEDASNPS